ncbi:hypothetical protein HUU62_25045, partial [Rhodoferax sp. 4810]|nr:hypothetical protein [Rhodoferax jenense]
ELTSLVDTIKRNGIAIQSLQLDYEFLNADFLFDKKQNGRAFLSSMRAISLAKSLGRARVIDSVLGDLEKRISEMDGVFGTDLSELTTFLKKLDGISEIQRDRLMEVMRHVKRL